MTTMIGTTAVAAPPRVVAQTPVGTPPAWAIMQRRLFDVMDEGWWLFRERYCLPDGSLRYAGEVPSRDGADDFYEAFVNWPVLYQLGGADDLLDVSKWHWEGVTRQLTDLGFLVDEFERGYDWFHLGESMIFFYSLCAADPGDEVFRDRAYRFAELYLPGSPAANYDPATRTIRAPHNGAGGPRRGINDEWRSFGAGLASMRPFGLPLAGVPGIRTWTDLEDPAKADLMGAEMVRRLGAGDVAVNLAATTLTANAWLYDHNDRFAAWTLEYLDAWQQRAKENGGVLPDNVGPSGVVGELHDGRWHGGNYGWAWPHGVYSVGSAACVAAVNGALLTGDPSRLDLARQLLDHLYERGITGTVDGTEMSIRDRWQAELGDDTATPTLLIPNRYGEEGWFDYQPPQLGLPVWLWQAAFEAPDRERLNRLRERSGYDWRTVRDFRNKEDAGHEAPWLAYLAGDNPGYPEAMLGVALSQVQRRMDLMEADRTDPADMHVHHWQRHNPVATEALLQLTTGTPQLLYNGGLLPLRILYLDPDRGRPGLPADVAALVDTVEPDRTGLQLVNLSATQTRRVVVQAGGFGTERIDRATVTTATGEYPGPAPAYTAPSLRAGTETIVVDGNRLEVTLPPGRTIRLDLELTRNAYRAAHLAPAAD
ncbi:hypothetical protein EV644_109199 [Kribbella orskensis]|uniref:Linalool dehydratase/isomerase domain-containing protein n=2 Tax=Kribbellaceae TaxID=2726069 RepID=A0ABY2BJX4_9ACTN|nr:hypothetical protein EV642_10977 [Kribbella sp. VKM Ac-2500]TCO20178.1 hypothetical protein EV644_109199 [Kribbella orskensis]